MNARRYRLLSLCCLAVWLVTPAAYTADMVVVVNAGAPITHFSRNEVINIYMGRQRQLVPGTTALPLDLAGSNDLREEFYRLLLDKPLSEINSYWARLIFSGQGSPPRRLESVEDVVETIRKNEGAFGYIPASAVGKGLKVVYSFEDN